MRSPNKKKNGMIAIVDGVAWPSYSEGDIKKFLQSRNKVLALLDDKIEGMSHRVNSNDIGVFTFNDTILIAYKVNVREPTLPQIATFFINFAASSSSTACPSIFSFGEPSRLELSIWIKGQTQ